MKKRYANNVAPLQQVFPLPQLKADVLYIDPPWDFKTRSDKGKGKSPEANGHYPVMSFNDIKKLDVQSVTADDAIVFVWTTGPFLEKTFEVLKAWDLTYKTMGFSWLKLNRKSPGLFMGGGYHTRSNGEFCLLSSRGKGIKRVNASVRMAILEPVGAHSAKPLRIKDDIRKLYGTDQTYLELFARERTNGWHAWGADVPPEEPT
jgi:N6-adenosine-specific RNA methylase IME4